MVHAQASGWWQYDQTSVEPVSPEIPPIITRCNIICLTDEVDADLKSSPSKQPVIPTGASASAQRMILRSGGTLSSPIHKKEPPKQSLEGKPADFDLVGLTPEDRRLG
jgi:hypothetical protein